MKLREQFETEQFSRSESLFNIQDIQQTDTTYVGIKRIDYL